MSNSILEGELIVKEGPDIILNKEKVFRSSFRSSVRETGAVLSFPGLNCTFCFMDGRGHKVSAPVSSSFHPVYLCRVRVLCSGSLDGYGSCWENTLPGCRKPVSVACTTVTHHPLQVRRTPQWLWMAMRLIIRTTVRCASREEKLYCVIPALVPTTWFAWTQIWRKLQRANGAAHTV